MEELLSSRSPSRPNPAGGTRPTRRVTAGPALLAVVLGAQFMVVIDETVVNVALPSIRRDLGMDNADLAWVVNAYLLLFGGLLLLAGRLADLVGRRRLYLAGLTLFTVASLTAGSAGDPTVLVLARAAQGAGGALLSPAALSILTTTYRDPRQRRLALAAWAATLGLGATLGVLLGGFIVEYSSWHWIFLVNGPVGGILLIACLRRVPADRPAGTGQERRLDVPGAVLVTAAGLLLAYTVVRTEARGWGSAWTIGGLTGVAVLVVALIGWERLASRPLIPADVVLRRAALAYPVAALTASALFGMFFMLTLYMQMVLGWSALRTGAAWAPHGATVALVSGVAATLVPRLGARTLGIAGLGTAACAQLLLTRIDGTGSYLHLLPALLLNGIGLGLGLVPITAVAVSGLADDRQGIASGMVNAAQQLGGAVGLAALVSVVAGRIDDRLRDLADPAGGGPAGAAALTEATVDAFGTGFALGAVLLVLAAGLTALLPRLRGPVDLADLV